MPASLIHSLGRYDPPPNATLAMLINRLELLLEVDCDLRDAGYTVHKEEGLYEAEVVPGLAFCQVLYESYNEIDRDMQRLLQLAIDTAVSTALNTVEGLGAVGELGPWKGGQRCVDTLGHWIAHLREHLKTYQGGPEGFFPECCMAFPDFVFSSNFPNCLGTFKGSFTDFIVEIVSALASLSNKMPECMEQPTTYECMKAFTAMSGYETSMEGDAERKDALTFEFIGKEGALRIVCVPHIKLDRSARAGDTEYYFHRIYFSTEQAEFPGKTLIGHIGEHL